MSIEHYQSLYSKQVISQLQQLSSRVGISSRLQQAISYALLNGGKRVRPLLVYLTNQMLKGDLDQANSAACAIEAIHCYSLVHDDLPAMDDDDLRRGKPTCHIAFDDATAILAGDSLQSLAFEWLAADSRLSAEQRTKMVLCLARASGDMGMAGGQAFDLEHVGKPLTLSQLEAMHRYKTGALIQAAIDLGAISSGATLNAAQQQGLQQYGAAIGLAFQVKDDLLDIEGDSSVIGKPQGSDQASNKPTYPALLGLDGAKEKLAQLHQQALSSLEPFADEAAPLKALADFIVQRNH